jgi:hypothetical protein
MKAFLVNCCLGLCFGALAWAILGLLYCAIEGSRPWPT